MILFYNIRTKCGDVMSWILQVNSLKYSYASKCILSDISFSVNESEIVSIIGPSSCGKTTLLKLVAGLLPSSNSILFGYGYLNKKNKSDLKKIGCVMESAFVFLFDTVYQELSFPLENLCYKKEKIENKILELATTFDFLDLLDKRIEDLTEEEKSILMIMLAIISDPILLILDNPFLNFRKSTKVQFMKNFRDYCKRNEIAVLFATSNLEDILISDTTYVLNDGIFVIRGDTRLVLREDDAFKKLGLDLSFMPKLSNMLIFYEILDQIYLEPGKLVNYLWKSKSKV